MPIFRRLIPFAFTLLLFGCSESLLFHPRKTVVLTPELFELPYETRQIQSDGNVTLHAWLLPAEGGEANGTVLFFHGNGGNISTHLFQVFWLAHHGYNVVTADYRGYGRSGGEPTLEGVLADVEAALAHVADDPRYGSVPLVLFGQSLGGSLVLEAAARSPHRSRVAAIVVDGTFSRYGKIGRDILRQSWLTWPFHWLGETLVDPEHDPVRHIGALSPIPVVITHGDRDRIVSPDHGKRLFEAAKEPKRLQIWKGRGHIAVLYDNKTRKTFLDLLAWALSEERGSSR